MRPLLCLLSVPENRRWAVTVSGRTCPGPVQALSGTSPDNHGSVRTSRLEATFAAHNPPGTVPGPPGKASAVGQADAAQDRPGGKQDVRGDGALPSSAGKAIFWPKTRLQTGLQACLRGESLGYLPSCPGLPVPVFLALSSCPGLPEDQSQGPAADFAAGQHGLSLRPWSSGQGTSKIRGQVAGNHCKRHVGTAREITGPCPVPCSAPCSAHPRRPGLTVC